MFCSHWIVIGVKDWKYPGKVTRQTRRYLRFWFQAFTAESFKEHVLSLPHIFLNMFLVPSCFKYTRVFFFVCVFWHVLTSYLLHPQPDWAQPAKWGTRWLLVDDTQSRCALRIMCWDRCAGISRHKLFRCFFLGDVCGMQLDATRRFWSSSALNSGEHLNALNSLDSTREDARDCKSNISAHVLHLRKSPHWHTYIIYIVYKSLDPAALKIDQ